MDADVIAAFFTGVGAVLSAIISLHLANRRGRKNCNERIAEIKQAMREGMKLEKRQ